METTTTSNANQEGKAGFIPIPLEKMKVGHAGLYVDDANETIKSVTTFSGNITDVMNSSVVETIPIEADIKLGIKGGKTLIDCEKGIKAFVKELAEDKENGLPNKETGVWIHYLTEGIERDFHRTWDGTPVSLQAKSKLERDIQKGKRILSKKEKNELLSQTTWDFYSNDVAVGNLTTEQAFEKMKEAIEKVELLKEQGLYLSPNKTEGVKNFDWKSIVEETCKSADAVKIYTRNKVEIVVPNIIDNFYKAPVMRNIKSSCNQMLKCSGLFTTLVGIADTLGISKYGVYDEYHPERGGVENFEVKSLDDLIRYFETDGGRAVDMKEIKSTYDINAIHLVKIKLPGQMKPRFVCFDLKNKKTGERQLRLMGDANTTMTLK